MSQTQTNPNPTKTTVHYTELAPLGSDHPLFEAWSTYLREIENFLVEKNENKAVLIHEEKVIGIYETMKTAYEEGLRRFYPKPFLAKIILEEEPIIKAPRG